jgi:hypothetical protein
MVCRRRREKQVLDFDSGLKKKEIKVVVPVVELFFRDRKIFVFLVEVDHLFLSISTSPLRVAAFLVEGECLCLLIVFCVVVFLVEVATKEQRFFEALPPVLFEVESLQRKKKRQHHFDCYFCYFVVDIP